VSLTPTSGDIARIERLASLGLGAELILPELLSSLNTIVDFGFNMRLAEFERSTCCGK
jgi:hypothetical protein